MHQVHTWETFMHKTSALIFITSCRKRPANTGHTLIVGSHRGGPPGLLNEVTCKTAFDKTSRAGCWRFYSSTNLNSWCPVSLRRSCAWMTKLGLKLKTKKNKIAVRTDWMYSCVLKQIRKLYDRFYKRVITQIAQEIKSGLKVQSTEPPI